VLVEEMAVYGDEMVVGGVKKETGKMGTGQCVRNEEVAGVEKCLCRLGLCLFVLAKGKLMVIS